LTLDAVANPMKKSQCRWFTAKERIPNLIENTEATNGVMAVPNNTVWHSTSE